MVQCPVFFITGLGEIGALEQQNQEHNKKQNKYSLAS